MLENYDSFRDLYMSFNDLDKGQYSARNILHLDPESWQSIVVSSGLFDNQGVIMRVPNGQNGTKV